MKKEFVKHKDFFLVVLSILVICLSLIILHDKFIKKNNDDKNIIDNYTQEIDVIDYVNYSVDKSKIQSGCVEHGIEVIRIPMLDSNKKGAIELNNQIKTDLKIYIEASKRTEEETLSSDIGYSMNYSYEKYKNYISIKIIGGSGPYCGASMSYSFYYTYDIENDKVLTNDELLTLVKLSKTDVINNVKLDIEEINYSIEQKNEYINYAIDEINNNLYDIYINFKGEVIIEIKYETHSLPLIYTYAI